MLFRIPQYLMSKASHSSSYLHNIPVSSTAFIHTTIPNQKSDLAKLRKKTGYSISVCKKALSENNNDFSLAETWLKEQAQAQGWAKAQKLQGRNTSQGLLGVKVKDQVAAVVELNCETDFVARNKKFIQLLDDVSTTCVTSLDLPSDQSKPLTKIDLSKDQVGGLLDSKGTSLSDIVALNIGQIGENITVGKATVMQAGEGVRLTGLSHPSIDVGGDKLQFGRYVALMAYTQEGELVQEGQTVEGLARQVCQHIIGMAPTSINNEEDKDNSLLHQSFLLDEDLRVGDILNPSGIEVLDFVRCEVGRDGTAE